MNEETIYREVVPAFRHLDFTRLYGKRILITGATGLVGTYLIETVRFLNQERQAGIHLYILSHNGLPAHLAHFAAIPWTTAFQGDLSDDSWRKTLPKAEFIIHAAGYGQPGKFTADPVKTLRINTAATADLLDKLEPGGSFLFISTSEIYSGSKHAEYDEEDIGTTTPQHPRACYIEGKRCGEAICMAYRARGADAKCARLALAYGPGTRRDDRRVLNEFIRKACTERQIKMMDSGKAMRTYCYVTDAVELMWQILLFGTEPVYNVGGHSAISIADLAAKIGAIAGVSVEAPPEDRNLAGAPQNVRLNVSKAEMEFHKYNYIGIDDGLRRTIEWQKEILYCHDEPSNT